MIGPRYWSTGITIEWVRLHNKWQVSLKFLDDGWCDDASTEGVLRVRYYVEDLGAAIDTLKADAERMGIEWRGEPTIYAKHEAKNCAAKAIEIYQSKQHCRRIGWRSLYEMAQKAEGEASQ